MFEFCTGATLEFAELKLADVSWKTPRRLLPSILGSQGVGK